MREHRSQKSDSRRLTRSTYRLSPFYFHVDHTPCPKVGLNHYISLQPNQKSQNDVQNDNSFVIAPDFCIDVSIASFMVN